MGDGDGRSGVYTQYDGGGVDGGREGWMVG